MPPSQPAPALAPPPQPPTPVAIPEPPFRPIPFSRDVPPSPLAMPFVALNQMFDSILGLLPFGLLFTTRVGKNLVGVAGVLMLGGGLAWGALDYFGWTR